MASNTDNNGEEVEVEYYDKLHDNLEEKIKAENIRVPNLAPSPSTTTWISTPTAEDPFGQAFTNSIPENSLDAMLRDPSLGTTIGQRDIYKNIEDVKQELLRIMNNSAAGTSNISQVSNIESALIERDRLLDNSNQNPPQEIFLDPSFISLSIRVTEIENAMQGVDTAIRLLAEMLEGKIPKREKPTKAKKETEE